MSEAKKVDVVDRLISVKLELGVNELAEPKILVTEVDEPKILVTELENEVGISFVATVLYV